MKNLIKKILKENFDPENFDWIKNVRQFTPAEQFLYDLMSNLKMVESEKLRDWVFYKDENGRILMADNINAGTENPGLYVDYRKIWVKLRGYGLKREQIETLCMRMLEATHKRKASRASYSAFRVEYGWE